MDKATETSIRVTVGLCVKNAEKTIERCLMSIVNQSYPKNLITVVVVDGKSKDKTIETIKRVLSNSPLHQILLSDNGAGLGVARQIVVENTRDKYIVWVDADAIINRNFVRSQVEFMEHHPKVCVATGTYIHKSDVHANLPASLQSIGRHIGSAMARSKQPKRGFPPNDVSIYRVDTLRQVNGFDINIRGASEDQDVLTCMRNLGWLVVVNPQAKYRVTPRGTWQELWAERVWFGYGDHFLGHKYKSMHVCMYHIPIINFYSGFKLGLQGYRLTSEKKSFLFPFFNVFSTVAWWRGYIKAHVEGYGHQVTVRETISELTV